MQTKTIGQVIRDAQLGLFETRDSDFLSQCRAEAERIAKENGQVSINDIRQAIPLPAHLHPSVLGAVFRSKKFRPVGFTEASHAAAHARVVRVYSLV